MSIFKPTKRFRDYNAAKFIKYRFVHYNRILNCTIFLFFITLFYYFRLYRTALGTNLNNAYLKSLIERAKLYGPIGLRSNKLLLLVSCPHLVITRDRSYACENIKMCIYKNMHNIKYAPKYANKIYLY